MLKFNIKYFQHDVLMEKEQSQNRLPSFVLVPTPWKVGLNLHLDS